jgi:predicted nucleic acid-binding protein
VTITLLDTNVIVRYLTQDDPRHGSIAAALIDSGEQLQVSPVALLEAAYVLARIYGEQRDQIVDVLIDLLHRINISVVGLDKSLVVSSLALCKGSNRVSFGDALIHAEARQHHFPVYTFDQRFPSEDIVVRRPGESE